MKVYTLQAIDENEHGEIFIEVHSSIASAKKSAKEYLEDAEYEYDDKWLKIKHRHSKKLILTYDAADFEFVIRELPILTE